MDWKDSLDNIQFSIKTGDGKEYFPLWISTDRSIDFNTNTFNFIDVEKSLIERKKAQSSKFPLKFYFQGSDCITQSDLFEASAKDNRYWTVTHPFYGTIKGQPISISRNDANYNVSEIDVDFWETITFDFPKSNLSIQDNTLVKTESVMASSAQSYSSRVVPETKDIQKGKDSNLVVAKSFENLQNDETNIDYQNALSKAQKSANNLIKNPNDFILDAQALLAKPSFYETNVIPRVNAYKTAFLSLKKVFESKSDVLFFESQGATALSNLCLTSVNFGFGVDYTSVREIEIVVSIINDLYNDYLQTLDNNSTSIYDTVNSYQPYAVLQSELLNLIMFTTASLYNLAFDAQQERVVVLDKNSNIILLTHKYLGLASDENIQTFKTINNIRLNELLKLKKGRKIIYYV